jgi:hypothetical protein
MKATNESNANTAAAALTQELEGHVQTFPNWVLAAIAADQVDIKELVRKELAGRGLDTNGRWIGFTAAARLHKTVR